MKKLPARKKLIITHCVDSAILATTAGAIVALVHPWLVRTTRPLVGLLASLGTPGIMLLVVLFLVVLGTALTRHFLAAVHGVLHFPEHLGIVIKVCFGSAIWLVILCMVPSLGQPKLESLWSLWRLVLAVIVGLALGHLVARLMVRWGLGPGKSERSSPDEPDADSERLSLWFADDQPISVEKDNRVTGHKDVVDRIVNRLFSQPEFGQVVLPSVAIIGPYGSGKTSICNLVREACQTQRPDEKLPKVRFCRFEAWRYLTDEAAVSGLVDAVTKTVLAEADIPQLWHLPDQYINAVKESGGTWVRAAVSLVTGKQTPGDVLTSIGEALVRLNIRLLIFVDDLDRIEASAPEARRAVTQALNQLQTVPHVQYLIAVGPSIGKNRDNIGIVGCDLLKLTRFQELVPRLDRKWILSCVREVRDAALADTSDYYPWADAIQDDKDPLDWDDWYGLIKPSGFIAPLMDLLDTPRTLKCALRETQAGWNGGLRGEINWYELLLVCALRVAEPGLFEWIERDRDLFIHVPDVVERTIPNAEQEKARAAELKEMVLECLKRPGAERQKTVLSALEQLFPAFTSRIGEDWGGHEPSDWDQGIAYSPERGRPYVERFLSGCLAEGELPDQPTLQLIRRITRDGFDEPTFQSMYLESYEKLTGPLNKFIQFAGLLSLDIALQACDTIMAWVAIPGHAVQRPRPHDYYLNMMGDVYQIIGRSDARLARGIGHQVDWLQSRERRIVAWLQTKIDQYTPIAWAIPEALLRLMEPSGSSVYSLPSEIAMDLRRQFAERLRETYIDGDHSLRCAVGEDLVIFKRFMNVLLTHSDYEGFRPQFTHKLVEQAGADTTHRSKVNIVMSLVNYQRPITGREIAPEDYTFNVKKEHNSKVFDMDAVLPALARWAGLTLPDPVAQRAFEELMRVYDIDPTVKP